MGRNILYSLEEYRVGKGLIHISRVRCFFFTQLCVTAGRTAFQILDLSALSARARRPPLAKMIRNHMTINQDRTSQRTAERSCTIDCSSTLQAGASCQGSLS